MRTKRPSQEVDCEAECHAHTSSKRTKDSSLPEEPDVSSSDQSVSENSGPSAFSLASEQTQPSSVSSPRSSSPEEVSESTLSSSDEESSESDDDQVINISARQKPRIDRAEVSGGAQDLRARLATLIPDLARANDDLSRRERSETMEEVGDDEQYIEMNLGLGVLEEHQEGGSSSSDESSDGGERNSDQPETEGHCTTQNQASERLDKETNAMEKLLGHGPQRHAVSIEELD